MAEDNLYMWLLDFIPRVKNLRGVLYIPDVPAEASINGLRWIGRKFRYRDIGFHPSLKEKQPKEIAKRLEGVPFVPLDFHSDEMRAACKLLRPTAVPGDLWQALTLASLFACPLIVPSEWPPVPEQGVLLRVSVESPLDASTAKFHLRVCDYAAVDWFRERTGEILVAARSDPLESIPKLLDDRRTFAVKDGEKRFWRLVVGSDSQEIVLTLDPLALSWTSSPENVLAACTRYGPLAAALLSLVPAFRACPDVTVQL